MLALLIFSPYKRVRVWAIVFFLCTLLQGQNVGRVHDNGSPLNHTGELSDLAKENLSRVAASPAQIRAVLVKDAGLLVEMKRWVAKEPTDSGQIVQDSDLSDEAIFDRLDHDIAFRSVATRLVQRYGYLLPAPNPDSSFAKEEDLVLKERARRLVQIEAQEDSAALQPPKNDQQQEQQLDRTSDCNSDQEDGDCEKTG